MKIEIAPPQRFSQSGKSLLRLIQNNDMPVLDLLVRESIQNSLDAWDKTSENVLVEFNAGTFASNRLSTELEGITSALNQRYGESECNFISVSDSNTCGLTGDINDPNGEDGNLQKLIYQICRAQEGEGAGGSWGIGKTVYFRVGIGLVIYYSRIKLSNGLYESRMAASLVEDESKSNAMIPSYKGNKKRGVAWWGREVDENLTIATTNEEEIKRMLNIFNLMPYEGDKVGTTIIIPYTDNEKLLKHNVMEYNDSLNNPIALSWVNSIQSYLKVAIQRWYSPRLNNRYYYKGMNKAYLKVKINGEKLGSVLEEDDDCEPIFKVIKALYNRAAFGGNQPYGDIISRNVYSVEDINLRGVTVQSGVGAVAFAKVDKELLKMVAPYNKYSPLVYLNKEIVSADSNRPIICYTRKPGMLVSYETTGEWTDGIPSTDSEHFILGVFVLYSDNRLVSNVADITLEEYVRQSELADHTSWTDITIKNQNPRIVSKIKKQTASKIGKAFEEVEAEEKSNVNSGYSKFFGDMLLPPDNFGKRPTAPIKKAGETRDIVQHKDVTISMGKNALVYGEDELKMTFEIRTRKAVNYAEVENLIVISDTGGTVSLDGWFGDLPFEMVGVDMSLQKWENDKTISAFGHLNNNVSSVQIKGLDVKYKESKSGSKCGIIIEAEQTHSFTLRCTFVLKIRKNDLKIQLGVNTKKGVI